MHLTDWELYIGMGCRLNNMVKKQETMLSSQQTAAVKIYLNDEYQGNALRAHIRNGRHFMGRFKVEFVS